MNQDHYHFLEDLFHDAPINQIYKPKMNVSKGCATIRQEVIREHFHGGQALHGSLMFKLLDDAAFFACQSLIEDVFIVTGQFEITFRKPVVEGAVRAEGKSIKSEGRKLFGEASLYDEADNEVARGKGIFIKTTTFLSEL